VTIGIGDTLNIVEEVTYTAPGHAGINVHCLLEIDSFRRPGPMNRKGLAIPA